MSDERFNDNHHVNRFPLGKRVSKWMSFSPTEDVTAARIFKEHGGSQFVGGNPHPTEHFVPLMRVLSEIRGLTTTATVRDGGIVVIGADDFDW